MHFILMMKNFPTYGQIEADHKNRKKIPNFFLSFYVLNSLDMPWGVE